MSTVALINPSAALAGLEAAFAARVRSSVQARAFQQFAGEGFPHRRLEGWRWSDFHNALRASDMSAGSGVVQTIAPSAFADLDPIEVRIVNGVVDAEPMNAAGLTVTITEGAASVDSNAITLLNGAMALQCVSINVDDGVAADQPVLVRHINDGAGPTFAQVVLNIGAGGRAQLIETYEGAGASLYSEIALIRLEDGAHAERIALADEGDAGVAHVYAQAKLAHGAVFRQTSLSTGSRLSRHETDVTFEGGGGEAHLQSAALLADARHADFTSLIRHEAERCTARQLHKGVAADRGQAVFQGKFYVARPAQKTDSQMTANALLLSDMAEANHKPELEIYADDVECAHGSTAGALDDDALFYLRQRGLSEGAARALLIEAFAGEAIDEASDNVRDILRGFVTSWLEAR